MHDYWDLFAMVGRWLALHYKGFIGTVATIAATWVAIVTWLRGVFERRLNKDKEHVLVILRSEMAFTGLRGQTIEQIILASKPRFYETRLETVLRSLANENPPRVHCFGGRWYLGPLPPEVAIMLLKNKNTQ